jgi:Tol biopolymer transport system component
VGRATKERQARLERPQPEPGGGRWMRVLVAGVVVVGVAAVLVLLRREPVEWKDGSPAWSPDGKRLAFYSERDGNSEIYVMNADGSGVTRLTNTEADEGYPAWSPDGLTITFDSDRDGNFEIYAMKPDGSNVRRLTTNAARDVSASWSPDGSTIVFMSDRDGGFDLYKASAAPGAAAERVTRTGSAWFPVYAPAGGALAFHVGRDVHTMPVNGGEPTRLTRDPANGMYPSWSPDGRSLAFMSWRNGRTEIFTMQANGSDQKKLMDVDRGDAVDPRWSPDGSRIAFVHLPDGMNGRTARICTIGADGTGMRCLSNR